MARIRTIKPEFWEDEKIGSLSFGARLLFLCSLNLCDDEGYLRWNAFYLASHAFMYDDVKTDTVEKWMNELVDNELVTIYRVGKTQQPIGYIINFTKHQRIDKPQPSKYSDLNNKANDTDSEDFSDSKNDSKNDSTTEKEKEKEWNKDIDKKEINKEKISQSGLSSTPTAQKEKSSAKKEKDKYDMSFVEQRYQLIFDQWLEYKRSRGETYKSQQSLEVCYKNMIRDCQDDPAIAQEMVQRSIGNNYSGLFPLKGTKPQQQKKQKSEVEKAIESHSKAFGDKPLAF